MKLKSSQIFILIIITVLLAFVFRACGWYGTSVSGLVLEEGSNHPIIDALVVVRWHSRIAAGVAGGESACYHVDVVRTDKDGHYKTPFWWSPGWHSPFGHSNAVNVYKPEHVTHKKTYEIAAQKKNIYYLKPFKGTREERLDYLRKFPTGCGHDNGLGQKRLDFLAVMYKEAKTLMNSEPVPSQWENKMFFGFKWNMAQEHVDPYWKLEAKERTKRIKQYIKEYMK
ncbi:MAG: hypothetical protein OEY52_17170 [Gammaproteobacteria bacterium]|nr:hypothetical protein [Gammaproteobacteria bacterium]